MDARDTGSDQARLWNGDAGRAWVDLQESLDRLWKPFEETLAGAAPAGCRVLDVGCGTGATTLAAARRAGGGATGIDISEPMLEAARTKAERDGIAARFLCGNAQEYPFEAGTFDRILSRFGVMFFEDPVRAFANLRRAAAEGAVLVAIAWRGAEENPFMTVAERTAAPLLPDLPPREPDAPGQFAFADAERVRGILERSGWVGIEIEPIDIDCCLPEPELVHYFTRLGPVGRVLDGVEASKRAETIERVRAAFEPYVHGDEVRFLAACWMIRARTGAGEPVVSTVP
ncbi:MAG: class I SAM-dependent methyltransferase [Bryobacteraceae bacterium]